MNTMRELRLMVSAATLAMACGISLPARADPPKPAAAQPAAQPAQAQPDPMADARKMAAAVTSVAAKVGPSVVQLDVTVRDDDSVLTRWFAGAPGVESTLKRGLGSGVIISPDGHILTNNHVIDGALAISVRLSDGRLLPASLVGRDPSTDLALVKIQATKLPAAQMADSDQAKVGEWVVAIGSPFGLGHTVTMGVLSAKGRGGLGVSVVEDYLQTDASINPGNSGGPLVNLDGQVLGINTMIVGKGQGIGFAIPSRMAKRVAEQLVKSGKVKRAWLGVGMQDLTPQIAAEFKVDAGSGALVNQVTPNGPAQQARLQTGDIVATVGGVAVKDGQDLMRQVLSHDVGEKVRLEVIRAGKRYATDVVLGERPEPAVPPLPMQQATTQAPGFGMTVRDAQMGPPPRHGAQAQTAAQIVGVAPGSPADRAGLKIGDVVLQADGVSHPSAAQVLKSCDDGHTLLLMQRGQSTFYAAVKP